MSNTWLKTEDYHDFTMAVTPSSIGGGLIFLRVYDPEISAGYAFSAYATNVEDAFSVGRQWIDEQVIDSYADLLGSLPI